MYVHRDYEAAGVGCPRNNQIFFSVRTETNRNSICFGRFSVCFAKPQKHVFRFVSVCFGVSDRYRNKQNFLETNGNKPKKSQNNLGVLETVNFFLGLN
jgi:hypothetical protein